MGTWNINKLYGNDLALDIKTEAKAVFSKISVDEGIEKLCSYYDSIIDEDEMYILWFVIGDILWTYGLLTDDVKSRVLNAVNYAECHKDDIVYSEKFITEFRQRLISDLPKKRKIPKPRTNHSKWKEGDILAYKLVNERFIPENYRSLTDKYMLIRVVSVWSLPVSRILDTEFYDEYTTVMVYNWAGDLKDLSEINYDDLKYLPIRIQNRVNAEDTIYMKGGLCNTPSGEVEWDIKLLDNIGKYSGDLLSVNNAGIIEALELTLTNLNNNGYVFSSTSSKFIR